MKIFYTHSAVDDLERLYAFICQDNPKAAAKIAEKLRQAVNRLKDFPLLGKEVKPMNFATSNELLRDLITGKYVIRYMVLKQEIHILRIWHGKEIRP